MQVKLLDTTFSATKQTTYITLNNPSTATNMDIDYVRISEDIGLSKLKYITYEEYKDTYAVTDEANNSDVYGKPSRIYKIPKVSSELEYFGLSPIPDKIIIHYILIIGRFLVIYLVIQIHRACLQDFMI